MDGLAHHIVSGLPGDASAGALFDSAIILENGFVPFATFSVAFESHGEIPYHCSEHTIMQGTVLVE
jgi:plastocyanin